MTRKPRRKKGFKDEKITGLPVVEVHHRLEGEACHCPDCQREMKEIGTKKVRDEICIIPPKVYVKRHIQHSYECGKCHDPFYDAKIIRSAVVPRPVISHSHASPSSLAWAIHQKFELHLPLYRQENEWKWYGYEATRKTLANWINVASQKYLKHLYELIHEQLLASEVIHADETPGQILNRSDGRAATAQSRIWVARTTHKAKIPVIYYLSTLTRAQKDANRLLKGFTGYLHSDGFEPYKKIPGAVQVGCWAHMRRKFEDIKLRKHRAEPFISLCNEMFMAERTYAHLEADEVYKERQVKLKPLLLKFFEMVDALPLVLAGKWNEAVTYAFNQKESLLRVLEDGRLQLSNNICEQKIRPVTIGRKNYLFSASEIGAECNAILYTLIETAKEHGLNTFKYFEYLFTNLPNIDFTDDKSLLKDFLPWSKKVKSECI